MILMYKVEECLSNLYALIKAPQSSSSVDKHYLLLYYYSLYQAFEVGPDRLTLQNKIEKVLDQLLSDEKASDSILSFPVLKNLVQEGFLDASLEERIAELDSRLFDKAADLLEHGNLAFLEGATGILNYYVERLPDAQIESYVNKLLPLIDAAFGEQYFSAPLDKYVDLSITKGLSGGVMVLIKAQQMNIRDESLIKNIRQGILQILKFKTEIDFTDKKYSIFPTAVNLKQNSQYFTNQLSWSNSDLSQALLFYRAFQLFNDGELKKMADLVGLNTLLRKDTDSTGITHPHFDQGASGVAQIYKTLYTISNHQRYKDGYEFWIRRMIELAEEELKPDGDTDQPNRLSRELTGIALTLISYVNKQNNKQELSWVKCFLL